MSAAQDRAEAYLRERLSEVVSDGMPLASWIGHARRAVELLEGRTEPLSWGGMREAFGEAYDGNFGVHALLRFLHPDVVEMVYWRAATGEELSEDDVLPRLFDPGPRDAAWEAWASSICVGHRLASARQAA